MEADFADDNAYRAACRAWVEEDEALFAWSTSGAVNLSHEGCGYCYWLVVSGPERGCMWFDERPGGGTFHPLGVPYAQAEFAGWYLGWVEESEAVARQHL